MSGSSRAAARDKTIEVWEVQIPGTVWVFTYDKRIDGYKKTRVSGSTNTGGASKRLLISVDDRIYNQERVVAEMGSHDPFTNGTLVRISGPDIEDDDLFYDPSYQLTNADLRELIAITDRDLFSSEVEDIKSEILLRRMSVLTEDIGTIWQHQIVRDLVADRYPVGGTQRTVREMIDEQEKAGGVPMS